MFYYDITYFLVLLGVILTMLASSHVQSTYAKYARVMSASGLTGAEVARRILQLSGVNDVTIEHVAGSLTDHYDPSKKVVKLSDATYGSSSVAAVGVAAHECGHVLQHHTGYFPLQLRTALVPVASIGSNIGLPLIIFSVMLGLSDTLTRVGIFLFAFGVLFQIVTLPVELDASHRALAMLSDYGMLADGEVKQSRKVLNAAAMTYVASAAAAVLQLLRLVLLFGGRRNRR
ncbi:MAG: zinc metallopeptidase [Lachnospiraceae bacterium]|nr:zinc metallopeptidase [Lachnospiraceae bacterium]